MTKIMVVDDMAVFREPIAMSLRTNGFEVVTAENGEEAMRLLRLQVVDLILLDIAMPVMDGLEFLRVMRTEKRFEKLPVVLLTAVAEKDYVVKAAASGARDYLLKSNFSLSELLSRINTNLVPAKAPKPATTNPTSNKVSAPQSPASPPQNNPSNAHPEVSYETDLRTSSGPQTLKDIKPIAVRSEVEDRISAVGELKALSPTIGQIMKLTGSKDCSIERVAKSIKQDQALALKVLKVANSSVYARGAPVESIHGAVMRIGLSQIRHLAMNIAVIDSFSTDHERVEKWINTYAFWEHSIATGLVAARLAKLLGQNEEDVDMMFTTGLLHDVGRMVFVEKFDELYVRVLESADSMCLPLERVEKRMLLIDHADIMDRLLHEWRFPKHLINPVALHHLSVSNIRGLAPKSVKEVSILSMANRLAHALLLGSSGNNTIYSTSEFASALNVDGKKLMVILDEVPDETQDLKLVMLQSGTKGTWLDVRQNTRDRLDQPIRPIYASPDPDTDAYRVFVESIAVQSPDEKPNIAVVRIDSVRDRDNVTSTLRRVEAEHGVTALPLVIISPKGDLVLESRQMQTRQSRLLPSPTPVALFCRVVNELLSEQDKHAQSLQVA